MNLRGILLGLTLAATAVMSPQLACATEMRVLLFLSSDTPPYQEFASKLGQSLPSTIKIHSQSDVANQSLSIDSADLVVTVGMKATSVAISSSKAPILAVMVPKGGYEKLQTGNKSQYGISAIYLDQPWRRQLNFINAALPQLKRIGLVYSPESSFQVAPLRNSAKTQGASLQVQVVPSADELFSSLESVLSVSDVLLAIPDSQIYNADNIRNILLTSYRRRVPLVGFSQGYVNAGALAAIFSLPEQMAVQTAKEILQFEMTRVLSTPSYADEFAIAVNPQVARSLEISIPSESAIRKRMLEREEAGR